MVKDTTDKEVLQIINVEEEFGKIKEALDKGQPQIDRMKNEEESYKKLL